MFPRVLKYDGVNMRAFSGQVIYDVLSSRFHHKFGQKKVRGRMFPPSDLRGLLQMYISPYVDITYNIRIQKIWFSPAKV